MHPGQLSVYPNCSESVRRNGARRTCRTSGTNGGKRAGVCGCNTAALIPILPPSSSSALGVNSLPSASSSSRAASPSFAQRQSFDWQCQQALCSIHPSVPSAFLVQIVNPEDPDDGWMAAEASTIFAHRTVPRENSAPSHISFMRCLAVSTHRKPTVHAGCIRHKPRQQINGLLTFRHPKLTPLPV